MDIRNCTAIYQCPRFWSRLKPTDDPKVRFCDNCWEQVHLVETEKELADQSALGRCVAIVNLSPDHPDYSPNFLMGKMIDPSK
jgi:hypothetical protein